MWDAAPADGLERSRVSAFNFDQWRQRSHGFTEMASNVSASATLTGAGRLLRGLLFGVGPADPLTYSAVPLLLLLVSAAAFLAPARRAVRIDPVQTLRSD